ncbi:hypothetical protein [Flavobacterium sp.]|uniref:hypothetical protein n=1 Tax=Flavobacterium sp. TaxID=239 RepID=UPI002635E99E|nr:hypothetical protein [Flavobacterium sp.]MDG2432729.1 hypothetical protein [Flavobacterium sp.]
MNTQEIVVNLWFIVDIGTNLCYTWSIKPYALFGTDDQKLKILQVLAQSDYITVPQRKLPSNYVLVVGNEKLTGVVEASQIQNVFEGNVDYFITEIEKDLVISGNAFSNVMQKIELKLPNNPMHVSTIIAQNDKGETRPLTSEANKKWYEDECLRMSAL